MEKKQQQQRTARAAQQLYGYNINDDVNISPWRTLQVQPIWYRYACRHYYY